VASFSSLIVDIFFFPFHLPFAVSFSLSSSVLVQLFYNHKITQHFFFFTKRKPVLKEKQISSFGKAFLSKKRFLVKSRGFYLRYPVTRLI